VSIGPESTSTSTTTTSTVNRAPTVPPPAPPPPAATFNFSVSSIDVVKPRSLIADTVSATLSINALAADGTLIKQYGPVTRSLGNHGDNSSFDPGMSLTGIAVPAGGSLAVSFVVVNKGDWAGDLSKEALNALEAAGAAVLGALAQGQIAAPKMTNTQAVSLTGGQTGTVTGDTTTASVPLYEAILIATGIIVVLEGLSILFADCDGTVVPGVLSLGQTELLSFAVPGPWEITIQYPGTDSPDGCGPNSNYSVTYSIIGGVSWVTVPTVIGMAPKAAGDALTAAGLIVETSSIPVKGTVSEVITQSPAGGSSVPVSSEVRIEVGAPEGGLGGGGGGHLPP